MSQRVQAVVPASFAEMVRGGGLIPLIPLADMIAVRDRHIVR
jgi:hypothetical protein